MNHLYQAIRNRIGLVAILAMLACTAASCGPKRAAIHRPFCAFSDPKFMTWFRVCTVAAQYYVAKHEWPTSKGQLEERWREMLNAEKGKTPSETMDSSEYFDQFTLLDLRKKGENLTLHYRLKIDEEIIDQKVTLRPGATFDQILQTASE